MKKSLFIAAVAGAAGQDVFLSNSDLIQETNVEKSKATRQKPHQHSTTQQPHHHKATTQKPHHHRHHHTTTKKHTPPPGYDAAIKMPNIGYAARGYNIYYGNPHATGAGVDPGFKTYSGPAVFEQTYDELKITGDGRFKEPDGYTLNSDNGCFLSFKSTTAAKTSDYKKSLEVSVSADFSVFGASFSASTDFKHFQEETSKKSKKSVTSTAECSVYSVANEKYVSPKYTDNFKKAIERLPAHYGDGNQFFDFFDEFGTHVIKDVVMGARYGFTSYLSKSAWKKVESNGVEVSVAAQFEGLVKAGGKASTKTQSDAQKTFDREQSDYQMITLGSQPTKGDQNEWANQAIKEPMPITYTLLPLCDVIKDHTAKEHCKKALNKNEYCEKRIKHKRGHVTSCRGHADKTCVWSADCGPAQECVNKFCVAPHAVGSVVAINRYWQTDGYNSFHPAPAWPNEKSVGDKIFYALKKPLKGAVAINRYVHKSFLGIGSDSTFHPSPAWGGEHNSGDAIFFAYTKHQPGTVAINRYWDDNSGRSTFHPAPEWPNEHNEGHNIYYAYKAPATCSAHHECAKGGGKGDCCPTAKGTWLKCCDAHLDSTINTTAVYV